MRLKDQATRCLNHNAHTSNFGAHLQIILGSTEEKAMAKGKEEYEVDEILPFVGEFGRFQIIVEALLCIAIIPQTLQVLIMYFAAQPSPWKCALGNSTTACTFPQNQSFSSGNANYTARCKMPRRDWEFVKPKDFSIITQVCLWLTPFLSNPSP